METMLDCDVTWTRHREKYNNQKTQSDDNIYHIMNMCTTNHL